MDISFVTRLSTSSDFQQRQLLFPELERLARESSLRSFRKLQDHEILDKGGSHIFSPATEADRRTEDMLRSYIRKQFPTDCIFGEEFQIISGKNQWRWVIDPIDGTIGYCAGVPLWTTLIALEFEHCPVFSLISQPFQDENWIGNGQESHYLKDGDYSRINVANRRQLRQARLATTSPSYFTKGEAAAFEQIESACYLSRYGMDAYAYGLLAMGQIDLVIESGLKYWDLAALLPVVTGAGGVCSDWKGDRYLDPAQGSLQQIHPDGTPTNRSYDIIAAANEDLLEQCLPVLKRARAF